MRVFIHILINANISNNDFELLTVKRGQLITSVKTLSEQLDISQQNVRTALKHLTLTGEIKVETYSRYSIITIQNYEEYQKTPITSAKLKIDKQHPIEDSIKSEKKSNNSETIKSIVDYLNEKCKTRYKSSTPETQKLINTRLNQGFTIEDFKKVIDNKVDDWLNSKDMSKFLRPQTLFGTKFESYLNQVSDKAKNVTSFDIDEVSRFNNLEDM